MYPFESTAIRKLDCVTSEGRARFSHQQESSLETRVNQRRGRNEIYERKRERSEYFVSFRGYLTMFPTIRIIRAAGIK